MWPITCMSEDSNLEFIRMPLIKLVVGFVAVMDMKKLMHGISHLGGVDLLKYDYCNAPAGRVEAMERYEKMGRALRVDRPFYRLFQFVSGDSVNLGNGRRKSADIYGEYPVILATCGIVRQGEREVYVAF